MRVWDTWLRHVHVLIVRVHGGLLSGTCTVAIMWIVVSVIGGGEDWKTQMNNRATLPGPLGANTSGAGTGAISHPDDRSANTFYTALRRTTWLSHQVTTILLRGAMSCLLTQKVGRVMSELYTNVPNRQPVWKA